MSLTSRQRASACRATRMFTMSSPFRLISAGEPAPSITTTSFSARSSSSAAATCGQTLALRPRQGARDKASSTRPSSTTWLRVSPSGLSSSGFMRTSGAARAANAWKYWALPISPPATTRALLLMFCALNGATFSPWRAYQRHSAVASQLLPAPLLVPSTMTQRARIRQTTALRAAAFASGPAGRLMPRAAPPSGGPGRARGCGRRTRAAAPRAWPRRAWRRGAPPGRPPPPAGRRRAAPA